MIEARDHKSSGSYGASNAQAGIVGSAEAKAMTKGGIGLALHGTGKGYDIGIDFGDFNISPKK